LADKKLYGYFEKGLHIMAKTSHLCIPVLKIAFTKAVVLYKFLEQKQVQRWPLMPAKLRTTVK